MRCFCRSEETIVPCELPEVMCFVVQETRCERFSFEEQYQRESYSDQDQCYPLGPSPADTLFVANISTYHWTCFYVWLVRPKKQVWRERLTQDWSAERGYREQWKGECLFHWTP